MNCVDIFFKSFFISILLIGDSISRLTEEQKVLIKEYALLERNTPGTISGLEDIRWEKEEKSSEPNNLGSVPKSEVNQKVEDKPEQKPGILTRIKNAIFGLNS